MEQLKENGALTGSRSSGVAPWQEKMNREAANGSSVHEQLMNPAWSSQPVLRRLLVCLEAEEPFEKNAGRKKDLGSPACLEVHMV